jgi:hypothetical protein
MMGAVRGWLKVLMWAGILLLCAGIGAFVASRSNPFPPGVPDPGAVPSESPSPSEVEVRSLRLVSRTAHTYHVGGSCTSDWEMATDVRISPAGRVRGSGVARLRPGNACDFPSAQVQARRVVLRVTGRTNGAEVVIRFRTGKVIPSASQDLGAFVDTIETVRFSLTGRAVARQSKAKQITTPNGDVFASTTTVRLRS